METAKELPTKEIATPGMLKQAIKKADRRTLLTTWPEQPFYGLFVKDEQGVEKAVLATLETAIVMPIVRNESDAMELLSQVSSEAASSAPYVRQAPLRQLARVAATNQCMMAWWEEPVIFEASTLHLLGFNSLARGADGKDYLYQVERYSLEGAVPEGASECALQYWVVTPEVSVGGSDQRQSRFVYDDRFDWQANPWLPELPEAAVPRSSLTENEREVYDRWSQPLLEPAPLQSSPETSAALGEGTPSRPILPEDYLAGFRHIAVLVEQVFFPDPNALKLEVRAKTVEPDPAEDPDDERESVDYLEYRILLTEGGTSIRLYSESLSLKALDQMAYHLPRSAGIHPLSADLRALLIRYVSWDIFQASRRVEESVYLIQSRLRNLFSTLPDNAEELFFCNPEDARFPFLASFRCGDLDVPVMVLGMQGDNYVCNPLKDLEVPEAQVPALMPERSDLVAGGCMNLWDLSGSLLIPGALVEFPEVLYKGGRVSPLKLISKARTAFSLLGQISQKEDAPKPKEEPSFAKLFAGIVVGTVVLAMAAMLLST
ncbi:hypothetical protein [Marinobacter zhejiangensis]|uniref:Uncharacterized protein n=1 Tax=Marinobacter zhejiangensis TaxID=488535 RepID=A0A1I4LAF9_9GAMM|nr:hypothetical protein [Marinobacter zhejiangensis]SFL87930.1 hypothetical protein SAMN04487963_0372 [Marinobacter zhejiangensis]